MVIKVYRDGSTKVDNTDLAYTDWVKEFEDANLEYLQSRTRVGFTEWAREDYNRVLALEAYWIEEKRKLGA